MSQSGNIQIMTSVMKIAILVVSDTCALDSTTDLTGPALLKAINSASIAGATTLKYVADDMDDIQSSVKELVAERYSVILTAGGTGFSPRDNTPEAVKPLIEKDAPGLVAAMLNKGLQITSLAAIARPVAGVISDTLIVTLPGSPKGALENFGAIQDVIPHAVTLLGGANSRKFHSGTEVGSVISPYSVSNLDSGSHSRITASHIEPQKHTCSHSHSHAHPAHGVHTGPKFFGPAFRDRTSPFPLIPFDDALEIVMQNTAPPVSGDCSLEDSLGCVLSKDIVAPINIPSFRASIVDGYAVVHTEFESSETQVLPLSNISLASSNLAALQPHSCARITTGAPVPHGATAVVPVENTEVALESDGEELEIKIFAPGLESGDNIREIGSDVKAGSLVLPRNVVLSSLGGEIGVLASLGITKVPVYRKPVVGVISTGDEVIDATEGLTGSRVWDSNRPMLLANLRTWIGADHVVDLGIVKDNIDLLQDALENAFKTADLVVTSGGVSMGELDLLKPVIKRLGGDIKFGRVLMKPGKPVTYATFPHNKAILALPGNPVSCVVCLQLFGYPLIAKMIGKNRNLDDDWITVKLASSVKLDPRPEFQRGLASQNNEGEWIWSASGFQRSSCVLSMTRANALVRLPPSSESLRVLPEGTKVKALFWGVKQMQ